MIYSLPITIAVYLFTTYIILLQAFIFDVPGCAAVMCVAVYACVRYRQASILGSGGIILFGPELKNSKIGIEFYTSTWHSVLCCTFICLAPVRIQVPSPKSHEAQGAPNSRRES